MTKKIKEVKEKANSPIAEQFNKEFNEGRNAFLREFREVNSTELIKRLYDFMRLQDKVNIGDDGVYAFGAFGKEFFQGPSAPGTTGLEMYACEKYAQQYMKEYMSHIFTTLLQGSLDSNNQEKKEVKHPENDIAAKE